MTTDWATLSHAFGSAQDIPGLLARLESEPSQELWSELWGCICHQGSTYSASYAALPWLARRAGDDSAAEGERDSALTLAGAIVENLDEDSPEAVTYRDSLDALRELARARVLRPAHEYVYFLQTLLALEWVPVWRWELEGLTRGEFEVACPRCEADLFLAMSEEYGYFAADGDYALDSPARVPLRPADPAALDGVGLRVYLLASGVGEAVVAKQLSHLFGAAECPACGVVFPIADQVAAESV